MRVQDELRAELEKLKAQLPTEDATLAARARNVLPTLVEAVEVLGSLVAEHRGDCPKSYGYKRCTCDQDEIRATAKKLLEALQYGE